MYIQHQFVRKSYNLLALTDTKLVFLSNASQSYIHLDIETSELWQMMHKKNKSALLQSTNSRKKTDLIFPINPNIKRQKDEVLKQYVANRTPIQSSHSQDCIRYKLPIMPLEGLNSRREAVLGHSLSKCISQQSSWMI